MKALRRTPLYLLLPLALAALAGCQDHELPTAASGAPSSPLFLQVPTFDYEEVSAGSQHTCARKSDGALVCWGHNAYGQRNAPDGSFTQVSAGGFHNCAVKQDDGSVVCWGRNTRGQTTVPAGLKDVTQVSAGLEYTCALKGDGTVTCWGQNGAGQLNVPDGTYMQLGAGTAHACAVKVNDGTVVCWGANESGQATVPSGHNDVTQVSVGGFHTCVRKSNGTLACWGRNDNGQATVPDDLGAVTQVSAGTFHTCTRKHDGTVACWGSEAAGRTVVPAGLEDATQVSAGAVHTCARKSDGAVVCWGDNAFGQTNVPARGTTTVYPAATFNAPASVRAGESFTLELTDAQVPGYPQATGFTYAFDCGDGGGYGAFGGSSSASCPTSAAGTRNVKGRVKDEDGDETEYGATVGVTFHFTGFHAPINNDAVNQVNAGRAVPVKFSLGGDQGLDIFAGSPTAPAIPCSADRVIETVEETVGAGSGSKLSYDAATDTYIYVWKTDRAFANTCRTLTLELTDGTTHTASFRFTK